MPAPPLPCAVSTVRFEHTIGHTHRYTMQQRKVLVCVVPVSRHLRQAGQYSTTRGANLITGPDRTDNAITEENESRPPLVLEQHAVGSCLGA